MLVQHVKETVSETPGKEEGGDEAEGEDWREGKMGKRRSARRARFGSCTRRERETHCSSSP